MERENEFSKEATPKLQALSTYHSFLSPEVFSHDLGASARQQSHRKTYCTCLDLLQRQGGLAKRCNRSVELGLHMLGEREVVLKKALGRRHHMLLLGRLNLLLWGWLSGRYG